MANRQATGYTLLFATAICIVCGILVSSFAVSLEELQDENIALDKQKRVLEAVGLLQPGEPIDEAEVAERFAPIEPVLIELASGEAVDGDTATFDQQRRARDPATSTEAPDNLAKVKRIPDQSLLYEVRGNGGELEMVVLPIEGLGLWGTLYGFLALDADTTTVRGITYYQHKETPGLGGEVDNPRWKNRWPGRKAFDDDGEVRLAVIKGFAGSAEEDPYEVDGLAGATITSNGVTNMLDFWLGENGFEPYLNRIRAEAN
ncbi:MAG: Na(+)-translocating NADH-quinone reductase subunit C [Acidobacteria bacterium]|nr:Na(+)-translocating NADH-quinone reductase subunit C [Acidobacteriota bacterium]